MSADRRYEYVVQIDRVSILETQPLFAARVLRVVDQETGMTVAEGLTRLEAYGATPDDAFTRVAELADHALKNRWS